MPAIRKYFLDEQGRQRLLNSYDGSTECLNELERYFRTVPRWMIVRWASQLGLTQPRKGGWSAEEDAYLEKHANRKSQEIAEHLGRTVWAVDKRRCTIGALKCRDGHTLESICECLGCGEVKVHKWIKQGWLRGNHRKCTDGDRKIWYFSDNDIRRLIKYHPEEIDLRRVDKLWFIDLLLGDQFGLGPIAASEE